MDQEVRRVASLRNVTAHYHSAVASVTPVTRSARLGAKIRPAQAVDEMDFDEESGERKRTIDACS